MSIERNKLNRIVNDIIKDNLLQGYVPTAEEVILQISNAISNQDISAPFYNYKSAKNKFTTPYLNQEKTLIKKDVDLLFESLYDIYSLAQKQRLKIETEREKQEKKLDDLQIRLERLSLAFATPGYNSGYINPINTVSLFDLANTEALIDTQNKQIILPSENYSLGEEYKAEVLTTGLASNGSLDSFIRTEGLVWTGIFSSKTNLKDQVKSLEILITINEPCNILKACFPMLKPFAITISEGTEDGKKTGATIFYDKKCTGNVSCQISNNIKYVKIKIDKTEADKFDDATNLFYYYFYVDTIYLLNSEFLSHGSFQTKSFSVPQEANSLLFLASDTRPAATDINYFISIEDGSWTAVESGDVINLNVISYNSFQNILNSSTLSTIKFKNLTYSTPTMNLYNLAKTTEENIINPKLYKGSNCWEEQMVYYTGTQTDGFVTEQFFLDARKAGRTFYKRYVQIEPTQPNFVYNNYSVPNISAVKTSITVKKSKDSIERMSIVHSYPIVIYLRGKEIYRHAATTSPQEIKWDFKTGENRIDIYSHVWEPNVTGQTSQNILTINIFMNLIKTSENCHACAAPCKLMTIANLQYNSIGYLDAYALVKADDGKYWVIIKSTDDGVGGSTITTDLYTPYKLVYNILDRKVNSLVVRGDLFSPDKTITPIVNMIEVRYSIR